MLQGLAPTQVHTHTVGCQLFRAPGTTPGTLLTPSLWGCAHPALWHPQL